MGRQVDPKLGPKNAPSLRSISSAEHKLSWPNDDDDADDDADDDDADDDADERKARMAQ